MLPCRRFADVLADACARLGADVDRYSFIEVDLHHKLLAGLPAHSLALRPAHSRRHLYVTSYTEGFSHFVTSMTAPVASGWSVRRVGLAPTGKRRLLTAHANSGHSSTRGNRPHSESEVAVRRRWRARVYDAQSRFWKDYAMPRTASILSASLLAALSVAPQARAELPKPNIVFIMADDLGNADLGYRGGEIRSPNIDKLATEGVRLEDFYGMPVCTPSRAQLMTGRYAMRYGLQTLVIFPSHTYGLATDERTLPQALKEAGYKTLMVGKWHLGHADRKYWPQNRGFEYFYGNVVGEVDYFTRERGGLIDWQRNGTFLKEQGYYTTLIGNDAVRLIDQQDGKQPFFLYFASLGPHAPYQAPQAAIDQYKSVADPFRRTYSAMITELDVQVGRIVTELEKKGLAGQHYYPVRQRQRRRDQRAVRSGRQEQRGEGLRRRRHPSRPETARVQCAVQRWQG